MKAILFNPNRSYIADPPLWEILRPRKIFMIVSLLRPALIALLLGCLYPAEPESATHIELRDVLIRTETDERAAASSIFSAQSDTVNAGDLFVVNLPDSISGVPVYEYAARSLPLRSWLLKKSFFWRTTDSDRGDHALTFLVFHEARSAGAESVPSDSVLVDVTVR